MKNLLIRSLIIATIVFVIHMVVGTIISLLLPSNDTSMSYGTIGSIIYVFFVAFWAYVAISFLYLLFTKNKHSIFGRLVISFFVMIIAYLLFRLGDIIDGDFYNRFELVPLVIFLLTGPLFLIIESFLITNKRSI